MTMALFFPQKHCTSLTKSVTRTAPAVPGDIFKNEAPTTSDDQLVRSNKHTNEPKNAMEQSSTSQQRIEGVMNLPILSISSVPSVSEITKDSDSACSDQSSSVGAMSDVGPHSAIEPTHERKCPDNIVSSHPSIAEGSERKSPNLANSRRAGITRMLERTYDAKELISKLEIDSLDTDRENLPPPIIISDEISIVSRISYDSADFEIPHQNLDAGTADEAPCTKKKDSHQESTQNEENETNEVNSFLARSDIRFSKRLSTREKILDMKRENLSLKKKNLQLMMQLSGRQGSQHHLDDSSERDIASTAQSLKSLSSIQAKLSAALRSRIERSTQSTEASSYSVLQRNKSDITSDRILELEYQNSLILKQLQEAQTLQANDAKKIKELGMINGRQKTSIESLEQQLKDSNRSVTILASHLESVHSEFSKLKRGKEEEITSLQDAYYSLEVESSNTIKLLKEQLSAYQKGSRSKFARDFIL